MVFSLPRSLPVERPAGPLHGYKLGFPMLSADGRSAGFGGIWSSGQAVYRAEDTAVCFWSPRHSAPKRRCSCGFYCLHSLEATRAMACEEEYRSTVILEVEVRGRFIRYEEGFRYSSQRVLAVRTNRCVCGRPVDGFADSGTGVRGWMRLQPCCPRCRAGRQSISLPAFADLLRRGTEAEGAAVRVGSDGTSPLAATTLVDEGDSGSAVSVLTAEVALLQARVDALQAEVSRLTG